MFAYQEIEVFDSATITWFGLPMEKFFNAWRQLKLTDKIYRFFCLGISNFSLGDSEKLELQE
jgi:hypothetical protein